MKIGLKFLGCIMRSRESTSLGDQAWGMLRFKPHSQLQRGECFVLLQEPRPQLGWQLNPQKEDKTATAVQKVADGLEQSCWSHELVSAHVESQSTQLINPARSLELAQGGRHKPMFEAQKSGKRIKGAFQTRAAHGNNLGKGNQGSRSASEVEGWKERAECAATRAQLRFTWGEIELNCGCWPEPSGIPIPAFRHRHPQGLYGRRGSVEDPELTPGMAPCPCSCREQPGPCGRCL